jgi:hypothetical protein
MPTMLKIGIALQCIGAALVLLGLFAERIRL